MSKNEFKSLAKMFGVTDLRYSGKRKTMFAYGDQSKLDKFFSFFRDPENFPFNFVANEKTYAIRAGK